jgi:hypothetical protein
MPAHLYLRLSAAVCLGGLAISSLACSKTMKVNDAGREPTHSEAPPKTVVVFSTGLDETDRRALEDAFVTALVAHGVRATPSYKLFPGMLPSGKEANATLQQAAVDGALVSNLRVLTRNTTSVDVEDLPQSRGILQRSGLGAVYSPDHIADGSVVRFETSLWDLRAAKVVWSANTRTDKTSLAKDFVSTLTKEVVPEMVKAGALPPPVPSTEVSYSPLVFHSK